MNAQTSRQLHAQSCRRDCPAAGRSKSENTAVEERQILTIKTIFNYRVSALSGVFFLVKKLLLAPPLFL